MIEIRDIIFCIYCAYVVCSPLGERDTIKSNKWKSDIHVTMPEKRDLLKQNRFNPSLCCVQIIKDKT